MQVISNYPGLKKAALKIAYDNGMIHRHYTEEEWLKSTDQVIGADGVYHDDLQIWSDWLETLSDENLSTLCCGESSEIDKLISKAPKGEFLNGLLDDIFEA